MILFVMQKAAYELRISDLSSDVCASYLPFALRLSKGRTCSVTAIGGRAAPRQGSPERLPGSPRAQDKRSIILLRAMRNIVILTGAGVSAESGIDTFRGAGGLWEQHRVADVATAETFTSSEERSAGNSGVSRFMSR